MSAPAARGRTGPVACPADFAVVAPTMTQIQLCRHYRVGVAKVTGWLAETGVATIQRTRTRMPLPADFAARAPTATNAALRRHYGVGGDVVVRWRKEAGVSDPDPHRLRVPRALPEDLAAVARAMTRTAAALHYGVGVRQVDRWLAETGLRCRQPLDAFQVPLRAALHRDPRDMSLAGRAADHLRRLGPVHRCDPRGRADPKGTRWRRGGAVLTDQELIDRARRQGFAPDAWRDVRGAPA